MARIARAGIISPGSFSPENPRRGLDETLELFRLAEDLGFQTAGIRQRHLEYGSSSALTLLAAATQRTERIELETNVVPLGYEVPFRLAEDFSTVAALSGGRLTVGISTSAPHAELLGSLNRTDVSPYTDPYELIERFLEALRGGELSTQLQPTPYGTLHRPSIHPHIPGLIEKVWLGAGSDRSAVWAARQGLGISLGNLTNAVGEKGFEESQRDRIDLYLAEYRGSIAPRVAVERVILPLDSASPEQQAHYRDFAGGRLARTTEPQGQRRTVIQPDLIGSSADIIEALRSDPVIDGHTELRVALPYAFAAEDYAQIIGDIAERILPELGWTADSSEVLEAVHG
ncbi:LLM class flavin-dependent oxidoreductase [Corynebacterium pacaense]|uniref:LLM class flavin-dependent oxidoreductase n=1 Tax=Corynebacterium pacaense TaxID=1816684 RepID=UPI0009BAFFCF|nr:LLM class flavin-dependent oxidoreductase [Corynebacterium pacaense]